MQYNHLEPQERPWHSRQNLRRALYALLVLSAIIAMTTLVVVIARPHAQADSLFVPPRVARGATVGWISPASNLAGKITDFAAYRADLEHQLMSRLGLKSKWGEHAFAHAGYLAGTDEERAADINALFADPEVKFIIANRGGYGTARVLKLLDYALIAANPKPLMGYSDVTQLLMAVYTKTGMITFHGPLGVDPWDVSAPFVEAVIVNATAPLYKPSSHVGYNYTTVTPGKARGRFVGGNVRRFSQIAGSEFFPNMDGVLLFLEGTNANSMEIDSYLTQLSLAGAFDKITGVVWGTCFACPEYKQNGTGWTTEEVLDARFRPLGVPYFRGALFGHELPGQFVLPLGIQAEIDANRGTIQLLESSVA